MGSRAWEILVTNINDNLPHSRPNRATLKVAVGLILGVAVIVFWPQISAFAHISQIWNALGLLRGLFRFRRPTRSDTPYLTLLFLEQRCVHIAHVAAFILLCVPS